MNIPAYKYGNVYILAAVFVDSRSVEISAISEILTAEAGQVYVGRRGGGCLVRLWPCHRQARM